jgi:hypothetical protein
MLRDQSVVTHQYSKAQAQAAALALIAASTPFEIEPMPFDVYSITVRAACQGMLPEPLAPNDAQNAYLRFPDWLVEMRQNHHGVASALSDSNMKPHFIRGLTPSEAISVEADGGNSTPSLGPNIPDLPVVVLHINGGAVYFANSTIPARLIILDEDIEGSDGERVVRIGGETAYCHDKVMTNTSWSEDTVHPINAARIASEVDAVFQGD